MHKTHHMTKQSSQIKCISGGNKYHEFNETLTVLLQVAICQISLLSLCPELLKVTSLGSLLTYALRQREQLTMAQDGHLYNVMTTIL